MILVFRSFLTKLRILRFEEKEKQGLDFGNCISNFFFIAMNLSSNDTSQTEPFFNTMAKLRLANLPRK